MEMLKLWKSGSSARFLRGIFQQQPSMHGGTGWALPSTHASLQTQPNLGRAT
jgi:hypothetical protein